MSETATVTSKSMVTIPAKIREKYKIKEGMKIAFVELENGILMIPLLSLPELRGIDKAHEEVMKKAIREMEDEHRREARE